MQVTIAYYEPRERPAPSVRPDFAALPLAGKAVRVGDMRACRGGLAGFSLDVEGFTVVTAPTGVVDFHDRGEVLASYVGEVSGLLRSLTGCTATAVLSSPVVRVGSRAGAARPTGATFTGDFAHADYSAAAARQMLRRHLPPSEVPLRLASRYSVFNVWRTFSGPPQDVPLALCDTRSVSPADKQYCSITSKTAGGEVSSWENISYFHSAGHRWWYCPDMTRDEAYVFRSFDSDPDHAEQVPHSAFVNPACPDSAAPRSSVEVRMFAFYD
jgi:hypothetical protein